MNATEFGSWEMQAGNPGIFAFRLAFLPNPHGADDLADDDVRESWGSFTIWTHSENLCAHIEQGEAVESAHWYLLPLIEWFADNWDAVLHEERLPLRNAGVSAADSLSQTRMPSVALKQVDELAWLDEWSGWWTRHCIRSAREGGLFPDVYLRRYRDTLEVSTGAEPLPGIPAEVTFLAPNRTYRTNLRSAAHAMWQVLTAAAQELQRRLPESQRVQVLAEKVADLTSEAREENRIVWLSGLGDNFSQVKRAVNDGLSGVAARIRESITGPLRPSPLVVVGSAYARLLYGAISPATQPADVLLLTRCIVENYVADATRWLSALDLPLDVASISQLPPGEQGSRLGEKACELLGGDGQGWVDVSAVLSRLDIAISEIELSDPEVRAVSVFGPTQRPHVFRNTRTRWGQSSGVQRFTLAHELCHLLLDREYGDELAIATGPWAPLAIEKRANAFAAAFLMPTWLLRDALTSGTARADDPEVIRSVSAQLRVSASSLIDRLYNLGEITFEERIQLRSVWLPERG